uniref:DUF4126 domain-containing protein n=1 Tax=Magnetococcus massalia (strain MO-1) TaxID=451514 RepID=A0A1S7LKY8_MAGMO|nr:conserved membrane protein of unknown function [Candidatus Magnetococcus massalia]
MENYDQLINTLALTMGASWASGINLYAAMAVLGFGAANGSIVLPPDLQILAHPMVLMASAVMYFVEFIADKTPGVDTGWDTIHTFVRIPAGAMMAAGAVGEVGPAMEMAAAIMGGGLATVSHATKAGSRVVINTSPEPFSNWGASIGEDVAVIAGLWTALTHPVIFLIALALFILFAAWLLPKIWGAIKGVFRWIGRLFGAGDGNPAQAQAPPDAGGGGALNAPPDDPVKAAAESASEDRLEKLHRLKGLLDEGVLTQAEFEQEKQKILQSD